MNTTISFADQSKSVKSTKKTNQQALSPLESIPVYLLPDLETMIHRATRQIQIYPDLLA